MKFPRCNNGTAMRSQGLIGPVPKGMVWTKHELAHTNQTCRALDTSWNFRGATMALLCGHKALLDRYQKEWHGRNMSLLIRTKLETPIKWMEASRFSSSKESTPYTMWYEGDVHCGVWRWWGNTAARSTSKTDGKRCLHLNVPATPPSSSAHEKTMPFGGAEHHLFHDNPRSLIAAAVTDLLRRWQWVILEHPPYSPDMSPCDYDLFTKVKEPLRGTRYNTRDELTRAIVWSIWNINKDGRADGVRCLPNIWQKVINKVGDYIEGT